DAAPSAWLDLSTALSEDSTATCAVVAALPDFSMACCAFSLASLACSFNEPINCPDRTLVLTRHTSSSASDVTNKRVERFARRSFRSLIPFVSQSVNSAMYSPKHPIVTSPAKQYSLISHQNSFVVSDATSDAVRVILPTSIPL